MLQEQNQLKVTGQLRVVLTGEDGTIKQDITIPNAVTSVGKDHIAIRMAGTADAVMSYMALGTGTGTPIAGDTALTEIAGSRISVTGGAGVASGGNTGQIVYSATFGAGVGTSGAVTEAGIFNAASGPKLLARTTFGAITKGASDTLAISWTITLA